MPKKEEVIARSQMKRDPREKPEKKEDMAVEPRSSDDEDTMEMTLETQPEGDGSGSSDASAVPVTEVQRILAEKDKEMEKLRKQVKKCNEKETQVWSSVSWQRLLNGIQWVANGKKPRQEMLLGRVRDVNHSLLQHAGDQQ